MPKGDYYSPMPLDFQLLAAMPEKGTIGGIHWRGRRAKDMRSEIDARAEGVDVPMSVVQSRLRSMNVAGLAEKFIGVGGAIWARTEKGSAFLNEHRSEVATDAP